MKEVFNKKVIAGLLAVPVVVFGLMFAHDVSQALEKNPAASISEPAEPQRAPEPN